ncbi:acyltransferase [Chryseobacterium sp. SN22]|uniref:acyltransferase n=1 Tax=Chryseobacterium sp. SN22 TaxID=2606431 RepID=UPI0011EBD59C|nr:acyltransferase [Chryseobacterium sp. SN22]KAA0126501.1 acyltransferase [Chryseobacterium sp. SN22]
MLHLILEKLQRKHQLSVLKKNPNTNVGSIKVGINNHFILSEELEKVAIGSSVNFRNYIHILVEKKAKLTIGNGVFMNNFCSVNCLDSISIGENTLFGENVKLYDHNHSYNAAPEFNVSKSDFSTAPIKIGKNCWLGSNVTILKGVSIGDNCIIGAGCTVFKDVPSNTKVFNQQHLISKSVL